MEGTTHAAAVRQTAQTWIARHPLANFIVLAYAITWTAWLGLSQVDLGVVNAFGVIGAAGPALAAMIVSACVQPESSGAFEVKRRQLFTVIGLLTLGCFALRRFWLQASLVSISGRVPRPVAYPGLDTLLMDILASAVLAFILSGIHSSRLGVRSLLHSLDLCVQPVRWYWFVVALGLYPAIILLGNTVSSLIGLPRLAHQATGPWYWLLLDALFMFLYVMVGGGGLEEPGWRGFALPQLLKSYSPLRSSLILAVIWAFWHWPMFWFGYWEGGPLGVLPFVFGTVPLTILFTVIFTRTGGSLPVVIVFHTSFNITSLYLPASTLATSLWMLLILGIALWMWRFPKAFSGYTLVSFSR